MDLKNVRRRIIEQNKIHYESDDSGNSDEILKSEDSIRNRVNNLYKAFYDEKNILSKFPIAKLSDIEKEDLLISLFWKIENGCDREIISKLNKADEKIDLRQWYSESYDITIKDRISEVKTYNRNIVRKSIPTNECIKQLNEQFRFIARGNELIVISFDTWIQFITYRLYTLEVYKTKEVENITSKLIKLQQKLIKNIRTKLNDKKELNIDKIYAFDTFVEYLEMSIVEKIYIDIMKCLTEDMNQNKDKYKKVKPIYKTSKEKKVSDINIDIKEILCEGKNENDFSNKLEEAKSMIDIFSKYGGRKCSVDKIQDLKVYFREFYLDDTKHSKRARKAMAIIRNYLAGLEGRGIEVSEFENLKDYIFIREKITRGYYRESNKSNEYILRCKLYESAFELYSMMFLLFDNKTILNMCNTVNRELFNSSLELLKY